MTGLIQLSSLELLNKTLDTLWLWRRWNYLAVIETSHLSEDQDTCDTDHVIYRAVFDNPDCGGRLLTLWHHNGANNIFLHHGWLRRWERTDHCSLWFKVLIHNINAEQGTPFRNWQVRFKSSYSPGAVEPVSSAVDRKSWFLTNNKQPAIWETGWHSVQPRPRTLGDALSAANALRKSSKFEPGQIENENYNPLPQDHSHIKSWFRNPTTKVSLPYFLPEAVWVTASVGSIKQGLRILTHYVNKGCSFDLFWLSLSVLNIHKIPQLF